MVQYAKNEHINIILACGLSVCFVVVFSFTAVVARHLPKKEVAVIHMEHVQSKNVFNKDAFLNVQVEGKAFIVYDLYTHEIIASKNATTTLPLASITKVMTAVSSVLHKSRQAPITIEKRSIEDGYDLGLKNGQVWTLSELLKYTLIFSSNDGAEAVADSFGNEQVFLDQMNNDAKDFGLNFYFTDPAGRDENGLIGGKGSALDVAKLLGIARHQIPDLLDATTKKRQTMKASTGRIGGIPNTNQEIESMPGAEGSKTGYTDLAGGNLGIIVDVTIGHPVAVVVLGSTREGRFRDMNILYEALRKSMLSH